MFYLFYCYAMKVYHRDKDYPKARKFYEKAAKFLPNHAKNQFKIGMCYYKMKEYANAIVFFTKALELDPNNENYKTQLSIANSRNFFLFKPTKLWWQEIITLEQEIKEKGEKYELLLNLAEDCLAMKHYDKAAKAYKRAITLCKEKDKLPQLYYEIGYAYENLADEVNLQLAKEAYVQAISLDEELESKRYGIGVFHSAQERWRFANRAFLEKVESCCKDSIAKTSERHKSACNDVESIIDCTDDLLLNKVGESFEQLYEWESALKYYQQSLELNYQNPQTHFRLGFIREKMGDYKRAAESYAEGLRRNRDSYWIHRLGSCLAALQDYKGATEAFANLYSENIPVGFKARAIYTHYYETLPLREKTILYESFHGRLMSCNPYAIFKFLLQDERFKDWTHIWVLESSDFIKPEYRKLKNLILIPRWSNLYWRYLASAKYLINNTTFPACFIRKEGQFYLNTWHGTAMKTLGKYIKTTFLEHSNSQRNFLQTTHIINPNEFMQKVILEDYEISKFYRGKALMSGYARIDLTLQEENKQNLKEHFGIKEGEKVLLYAPTYRGYFGQAEFEYATITKLLQELSVMPFKILFKGHYETLKAIEQEDLRICDANDREIDTNELLSIVDVLITDYSSIAFDFMLRNLPIIYYAYDYEKYKKERGVYFSFEELGLKYCKNLEEVKTLLNDEGFLNAKNPYAHLKERFFPLEDGNSTQRIVDFFFFDKYDSSRLYQRVSNKPKILLEANFLPNGITSALKNLIHHLHKDYDFFVSVECFDRDKFPERYALFNAVRNEVDILPMVGGVNCDLQEKWLLGSEFVGERNAAQEAIVKKVWEREWRRMYGESVFDVVIDYGGYGLYFGFLCAYAPVKNKYIFAHNEMQGEVYKRFPQLEGIFYLYKRFSKVLSVSEATNAQNRENLSEKYGIARDKFQTLHNFINAQEVVKKAEIPLKEAVEHKYFKKGYQVLINLARLSIEKDQTSLIRAFARVSREYPKLILLILGEGPLREQLERLIAELGLKNKVFLLGFQTNPYNFLKRADFFALSSEHEGLPLVLAEAMILKRPILCTDFACAKDFLGANNEYGLVVPKGEEGVYQGLKQMLENPPHFQVFESEKYNQEVREEYFKLLGSCNV